MKKDFLNRDRNLQDLITIVNTLSKEKKGCTFAVDGKWGCGKSFLLDMLEEKTSILQSEKYTDDRYLIVRYDCWKYDYYTEPMVAILAEIQEQVKKGC